MQSNDAGRKVEVGHGAQAVTLMPVEATPPAAEQATRFRFTRRRDRIKAFEEEEYGSASAELAATGHGREKNHGRAASGDGGASDLSQASDFGFEVVKRPLPAHVYEEVNLAREHVCSSLLPDERGAPPQITMQPRCLQSKLAMLDEACRLRHHALCVQVVRWLHQTLAPRVFSRHLRGRRWALRQYLAHLRRRRDVEAFASM